MVPKPIPPAPSEVICRVPADMSAVSSSPPPTMFPLVSTVTTPVVVSVFEPAVTDVPEIVRSRSPISTSDPAPGQTVTGPAVTVGVASSPTVIRAAVSAVSSPCVRSNAEDPPILTAVPVVSGSRYIVPAPILIDPVMDMSSPRQITLPPVVETAPLTVRVESSAVASKAPVIAVIAPSCSAFVSKMVTSEALVTATTPEKSLPPFVKVTTPPPASNVTLPVPLVIGPLCVNPTHAISNVPESPSVIDNSDSSRPSTSSIATP